MITHLRIQNFTLIESLDIDFRRGFSVITGETGAGKSFILGALAMLLGHRADTRAVKAGTGKCVCEATFDVAGYGFEPFFADYDIDYDATECILRREISASGKSRAFINDTPVSLAALRTLGERLVDIHSQHQNLLLRDADFQLSVVDIIARDQELLAKYKVAFATYKTAVRKLDEMRRRLTADREQEAFMRFQCQELDDAALTDTEEQTNLEQQANSMGHTEDIKAALFGADTALNADATGILQQLRTASNALSSITDVYPAVREMAERMESAHIELKDIASEISSALDSVDYDPQELERITGRLDLIYSLERKHRAEDIAALIATRDELREKLSLIDNSDEAISEQERGVSEAQSAAQSLADKLTACRAAAAAAVEQEMRERLVPLGIPNVRFSVERQAVELSPTGCDGITFLFSANSSTPLQPVAEVASGGEIARVMLSLKAMISTAVSLPTIIFDEIDTGVSGKIADAMALIMRRMGEGGRQVISITHLPQIAAQGQTHYRVEKHETPDGTRTTMNLLSDDARIDEIAQMLSGSNISDAARQQAAELLKN